LRGNLGLGNTRELDRELFYKLVYLLYYYPWSVPGTVHPALNGHVVVATTCWNGTHSLLTLAKLSVGYLVVEIYKRTRQGALAALLLYLYKLHVVRTTTILTCPYIHVLFSYPITYPHVFSLRPLCFLYVP